MGKDPANEQDANKKRRLTIRNIWRLALLVIGVVAVVQELQKPRAQRTWQGKVAALVPYDFRIPTAERIRAAYWNPQGPFLPAKAFGVGWAFNLGALKRLVSDPRTLL